MPNIGTNFWRQPHLSRRLFFRAAGAVGGYFLLPGRKLETVARAASATPAAIAKNCILVMLRGAPSHCDTFDLKVGEWTPASLDPTTYNGVLFPRGLMPRLAERMGELSFVRSVRSWALVHGLADQWIEIARDPTLESSRVAPHIGSVVSHELGRGVTALPAFVHLNGRAPGAGLLPPRHEPLQVNTSEESLLFSPRGMSAADYARRNALVASLEAVQPGLPGGDARSDLPLFSEQARALIFNAQAEQVFRPVTAERVRYGSSPFGDSCIVARNLLRSGLGTRFVEISFGGWDHHSDIYRSLPGPASRLDTGLNALLDDLKAASLLDETLIVVMGEFGRTVGRLNEGRGRDHHTQQAVLFTGAKLQGRVIGVTDAFAGATTEFGWSRDRDIRAEDIACTIYSALGINWATVLRDESGRRFEYVPKADRDVYGPIQELF
jgi:hypothetical protein